MRKLAGSITPFQSKAALTRRDNLKRSAEELKVQLDDARAMLGEAVFARCLSAVKEERVAASKEIKGKVSTFKGDKAKLIKDLRAALYAAKIVSYAQGYQLMRAAAKTYKWNLNYGGIALVWRGGKWHATRRCCVVT